MTNHTGPSRPLVQIPTSTNSGSDVDSAAPGFLGGLTGAAEVPSLDDWSAGLDHDIECHEVHERSRDDRRALITTTLVQFGRAVEREVIAESSVIIAAQDDEIARLKAALSTAEDALSRHRSLCMTTHVLRQPAKRRQAWRDLLPPKEPRKPGTPYKPGSILEHVKGKK